MARKEDNLMPIQEVNARRTREQHSEDSRKAGVASGKARRRKKQMHEMVQLMLNSKVTDTQKDQLVKQFPALSEEDVTIASSMVAGQIKSAMKGNTKAFLALTELNGKGNAIDDNKEYTIPITDITIDYVELYRAIHKAFEDGSIREIISKGGQGFDKIKLLECYCRRNNI